MPRKKATAPSRLDEDQRRTLSDNAGPSSSGVPQTIFDVVIDDSDEEDEDFVPQQIQAQAKTEPKKRKPVAKPVIKLSKEEQEFKNLEEICEFQIGVSTYVEKSSKWHSTIGVLQIELTKELEITDWPGSRISLYFSKVPNTSFCSNYYPSQKMRLVDVDDDTYECLKCFIHTSWKRGYVSQKKSNLRLKFGHYENKILTLNIDVTEWSLFNFNHPSDVVAVVPNVVRKTIEHFLNLNSDEIHFEDNEFDDVELVKQDIDSLYNVIKEYHEANPVDDVIDPQHRSLLPQLRPYQQSAVKWMVQREKPQEPQKLHSLYTQVQSQDGQTLYYNRQGGYLRKDFPAGTKPPTGGILADEMGLGKTVEVLSCMLCNPRMDVPKPKPLEIISISKESRKRRRRRSPSPTEFQLYEHENETLDDKSGEFNDEKQIMQVDGNQSDSDSDFRAEPESEEEDEAVNENDESDAEYVPRPSKRRSVTFNEAIDKEEIPISQAMKKVASKKFAKALATSKSGKKSILKNTNPEPRFVPESILHNKTINEKSKLEDQILYAIVKKASNQNNKGASVGVIKKYLETMFNKKLNEKTNKNINLEIGKLVNTGKILNTSGSKGASGSFMINPDYENFDSRSQFANKVLDPLDQFIEDIITERCYNGKPYAKIKTETELKLEQLHNKKKKESLYEKMKPMYEMELGSEVIKPNRGKKWRGTYFDTKVEQTDFFECLCGVDSDPEEDKRYRVQCTVCGIYQHAECVLYDVSNEFRGEYVCPHCWTLEEPVESGATLIVSPSSISYQWIEEIQKHIKHKNVRMLFYKGTKASGYIQPRDLANYDIVVTTYSVLQSETNYVDLPHSNSAEGRRFRNPKRFMAIPAPLPCVKWWRMVMDEAQMLESTTSKTAEMALRLKAEHRWCVTGTPIGKSLNDLYGLFMFLNLDPYNLEYWWKKCLYNPYIRGKTKDLERVLSKIMWRTAKKDVLDQINIPKQTEEIHWLSFSPVEEHFYRRQHIDSSKEAIAKIKKVPNQDLKLSEMDRHSLNTLLMPLLRLRQSCCHPQAVKGQFMSLQKSTMTMEALMEQMIKKSTLECEEANRQYIASLNGLAGLDIIEEKFVEAVEKYREVLRFTEEYKDKIKTDTLQKLHTVTNLAELLEAGHQDIAPTLRDDKLRDEAKECQDKYLTKYTVAMKAAKEAVEPVTEQVEALRLEFKIGGGREGAWYVQAVNSIRTSSEEESLQKLVLEEMAKFYDVVNDREFKQIEQKYASSRMVLYKVSEKVEEIDNMRNLVCKELQKLQLAPPEQFLDKAVECHLRMSSVAQKNKSKCELCLVHDNIELYEGIIFHFVKGEIKAMKGHVRETLNAEENKKLEDAGVYLIDQQRQGQWSDSEPERLLKAILKYSKQSIYDKDIIEDGTTHMKLFESMKKEFKLMRILWRQINDNVAAVDELNMSIMRLRLRFEDEPIPSQNSMKIKKKSKDEPDLATRAKDKFETIYILEKHEIPTQRLKLVSEKTVANCEFRKKNGQLIYLENLQKSDFGKKGGGENPEPCPICQKGLGMQWSVLQCGHCFCVDCIRILIEEYSSGGGHSRSVKCAICRNLTHHAEISYVNTKVDHKTEEDSKAYEAVKGSLSTKMEAVVKTLIKIQNDDPNAKSLVFSSWNSVLDILGSALITNDIQFAALHTQGKFKRNLQKFKNRQDVKVLLLPISSGANGLNLIEASHVLLIEPILNPAEELQAIGRVHRIGQTKPTTIHRFLIASTIEERIYNMLRTYMTDEKEQSSHSTEENVLTIKDLSTLFVDS